MRRGDGTAAGKGRTVGYDAGKCIHAGESLPVLMFRAYDEDDDSDLGMHMARLGWVGGKCDVPVTSAM